MNSISSDESSRAEVLRSQMEIFKTRFVQRARDDAATLRDCLGRGDRAGLNDCAHRLAGIAATFGYPAIGEDASALQQTLAEDPSDNDRAVAVIKLVAMLEICNSSHD